MTSDTETFWKALKIYTELLKWKLDMSSLHLDVPVQWKCQLDFVAGIPRKWNAYSQSILACHRQSSLLDFICWPMWSDMKAVPIWLLRVPWKLLCCKQCKAPDECPDWGKTITTQDLLNFMAACWPFVQCTAPNWAQHLSLLPGRAVRWKNISAAN